MQEPAPGVIAATAQTPSSIDSSRRPRAAAVVALIAVSHGTIDAYSAFLHPLLPRIMEKLGLSITLAATLVMILSISTSVLQPGLGYLADRYGRRLFLAAGPVVTGVFLSLIGLAPTFTLLLACLLVGGLGSAAFHPPGAALVARAADGRGSGMRLSVFSFGGTAGYAMGPLIAVLIVGVAGLERLWLSMFPGILLGLGLWVVLRHETSPSTGRMPPPPRDVLRLLRGPLGLLFGISILGAFIQRTFLTMMPIIANRAGVSETAGAAVLSTYLGAQALGTLASGYLTDRVDRQRLLVVASVLAVPAHVIAVLAPPAGPAGLVAAVVAGFLNMALLPPIVVMAQEMIPAGAAVGSGIVMGLAWAVAALGIPLAGALGDTFGPVAAAAWAMPVMLLGAWLASRSGLRPYSRPTA